MRTVLDGPPDHLGESPSRKRKLAAILHADVVGFSRLMGEDEASTHQALSKLRQAVEPLIAANGGRIVGTVGDSLLADFSSVVDALNCAVEMQRTLRALNDPIPPGRRLELRIGVNLGVSSSMAMTSLAMASTSPPVSRRWPSPAPCISQTVYDQVRNKLDLEYRPLVSHRVKNIAQPVRAYEIGVSVAAPGARRRWRQPLAVAAGAAVLVMAGLVLWALHAGAGLAGCGKSPALAFLTQ